MALGTDLTNGLFARLAFGVRTDPDGDIFEKYLYFVHAKNDTMMRSKPEPLYGQKDKMPPFLTNLGFTNLILAFPFEIILVIGLLRTAVSDNTGEIPNLLQFVSSAFIFRGITEIMYAHQQTYIKIEPLRGTPALIYWLEALPQIYIPFLIAERYYCGTYKYEFDAVRFFVFLAIPTILILFGIVVYSW